MVPINEMGVIAEFASKCNKYGIEILQIQAQCPDAIIRVLDLEIPVEFEFESKNFRRHKHPENSCELIICWKHNWQEATVDVIHLDDPYWHLELLEWALGKQTRAARAAREIAGERVFMTRLQMKILEHVEGGATLNKTQLAQTLSIGRKRLDRELARLEEAGYLNGQSETTGTTNGVGK